MIFELKRNLSDTNKITYLELMTEEDKEVPPREEETDEVNGCKRDTYRKGVNATYIYFNHFLSY